MAHSERQQITGVVAARDTYAADEETLNGLVAQLTIQDADLAAKKAEIEGKRGNLQELRTQATAAPAAARRATAALEPLAQVTFTSTATLCCKPSTAVPTSWPGHTDHARPDRRR